MNCFNNSPHEGGNPKSEVRNPKEVRSPKSEVRNALLPVIRWFALPQAVGARRFGFRASDFGLRIFPRLLLLAFVICCATAQAQDTTNSPPPASPVAAADPTGSEALQGLRGNLVINSRTSEFDLKSNTVIYLGSVRVEATNTILLCEYLSSALPSQGGKIERVVARTNVVIDLTDEKGQKLHATGEQAVYSYIATPTQTNEIIELTGDPKAELPQGTLAGDVITYDLNTGKVRATNPRTRINQDTPGTTNAPTVAPATNGTPVSTNLPAETKPQ